MARSAFVQANEEIRYRSSSDFFIIEIIWRESTLAILGCGFRRSLIATYFFKKIKQSKNLKQFVSEVFWMETSSLSRVACDSLCQGELLSSSSSSSNSDFTDTEIIAHTKITSFDLGVVFLTSERNNRWSCTGPWNRRAS